jgi:hypothetical protein
MDVRLAGAALELLGIRFSMDANPIGLAGRREQADAVHARCCAYVVGQLARRGWQIRVEVEIGEGRFRGWIDILAFRPADGALLVIEVKTEIDDVGRILRSLGWYVRSGRNAAVALGWRPRRIVPVLLALATTETDARLVAAHDLIRSSLPGAADALAASIHDAAVPLSRPSLALIDPRRRRRAWLVRPRWDGRRTPAPYADLRQAAAVLSATTSPRRRP